MNIKLKPRSSKNGTPATPQWEQDDAQDKLAEQLDKLGPAPTESLASDVKPAVAAVKPAPAPPPVKQQQPTVNVKELLETLLAAYTAPDVHMWIEGAELCFEQIVDGDQGGLVKNMFRLKIANFTSSSVKLIK